MARVWHTLHVTCHCCKTEKMKQVESSGKQTVIFHLSKRLGFCFSLLSTLGKVQNLLSTAFHPGFKCRFATLKITRTVCSMYRTRLEQENKNTGTSHFPQPTEHVEQEQWER